MPDKGYAYISFAFYGRGDGGQTPKITINGFALDGWHESSHTQGDGVFLVVDKADQISVTNVSSVKIFFIPSK